MRPQAWVLLVHPVACVVQESVWFRTDSLSCHLEKLRHHLNWAESEDTASDGDEWNRTKLN